MADDPIEGHVAGIKQGVHDLLYKHPVMGPILKLVGALDSADVGKPAAAIAAAAPASPAADADLDRPYVHDIRLPVAKPVTTPTASPIAHPVNLSARDDELGPRPIAKPKSLTSSRSLRGGKR